MFCSRCGLKVEEGQHFCQSCGQEVGGSAPAVAASGPVSAPLPYAGFWIRFAAYLIDGLILGIPYMIVLIVWISSMGGFAMMLRRHQLEEPSGMRGLPPAAGAFAGLLFGFLVVSLFFLALNWLYFAGLQSSERQATFGKAILSLRVTDLEGRRLSFGHATGRFFAKIVSGMIPFAIGYIMAGFTAKKQALHDMIAGTLVFRNR
ncbi:MAG: RDD family protein [Candidatus Acidiferrales bacterium]